MPRRIAAIWPALALATAIAAPSDDAQLDARVHALSQQLRCVVCQNQTLADSQAELAVDLRRQIREQLREGVGDEAVKAYLVQRYGDFVLYDPPLKPSTWLLWFGPLLLLALAALAVVRSRLRRPAAVAPLDDAARQRADALLDASRAPAPESGR
ncbi:cytochrome c-type biogenesis protein [Variovorax sp. J31P207]|uniref:cytochrome c-type biogenesis protein n=1 Tax=Variovorax sp. J31P207 TaxID=3053510 RepID=UPI002577D9E9|nr:cytochrome c-type biogenesis protein [Variovorax sp. J31P207]MDM0065185.1 cytochrome c-type biogenesis protein CcmH [Variovorax sp. J31P207]